MIKYFFKQQINFLETFLSLQHSKPDLLLSLFFHMEKSFIIPFFNKVNKLNATIYEGISFSTLSHETFFIHNKFAGADILRCEGFSGQSSYWRH